MKEKNEIREIPVISENEIRGAGLQTQTRTMRIKSKPSGQSTSDKQILDLLKEIHDGLKSEVYDMESVRIIRATKIIVDLPAIAIKLQQPDGGYIKVAVTDFPMFMEAVNQIPIRSLRTVPEKNLQEQNKEFLKRLEKITIKQNANELRTVDPKEFIKRFFHPHDNLYVGIEMIMQAIAVSCVKQSCESILESMVSTYEHHFNGMRNMDEDNINEEFFIAVNGPNLAHCNSVVEKAMTLYWKGYDWHFYRTCLTHQLKEFDGDSKVLHRLLNTSSKFPFME